MPSGRCLPRPNGVRGSRESPFLYCAAAGLPGLGEGAWDMTKLCVAVSSRGCTPISHSPAGVHRPQRP